MKKRNKKIIRMLVRFTFRTIIVLLEIYTLALIQVGIIEKLMK